MKEEEGGEKEMKRENRVAEGDMYVLFLVFLFFFFRSRDSKYNQYRFL